MDLSALLRTSLPAYENILAAQGKRLVMAVDDGVVALASDELMEPVIENLLENAASFTPENGVIEVRLAPDGGDACFSVMDRGPGVAAELLPRIFDRSASFRACARSRPRVKRTCSTRTKTPSASWSNSWMRPEGRSAWFPRHRTTSPPAPP